MTAAPRTLLQIVNQAQGELGLPQAATVIGNADPTTVQMVAILQKIGEELRDIPEDGWTSMHVEFDLPIPAAISTTGNFTANSPVITAIPSTAGISAGSFAINGLGSPIATAARVLSVDNLHQITMTMEATGAGTAAAVAFAQDTFTLPSDFRQYSNRTMWDRTNRWELLGPDSPQMDQWHRSGIVVTGPRRHFRNIGRIQAVNPTWRLWPAPFEIVNPIQIAFEYLSSDWICAQGGAAIPPSPPTYASTWANDTDIPVLDDRALADGLKWMFWMRKGFGALAEQGWWLDLVDRLIARDGGAPTLQLAKRTHPLFLSPSATQDGFFSRTRWAEQYLEKMLTGTIGSVISRASLDERARDGKEIEETRSGVYRITAKTRYSYPRNGCISFRRTICLNTRRYSLQRHSIGSLLKHSMAA